MTLEDKTGYKQQLNDVKGELKKWESNWASDHNGNKPGRHDIKNNPEIAQKYKLYNRIRDILAGKLPATEEEPVSRKRKAAEVPCKSPSKRSRTVQTPQVNSRHTDASTTPSTARKLFTPNVPTSIGPTPQRDGRVLGLFDLLSGAAAATPSRSTGEEKSETASRVQATPSKRTDLSCEPGSAVKLGRTPMSTSKRILLDSFMTPLKKRDANVRGGKTPTSVSKLQFATPAFLKRAPLQALDENSEFKSPEPIKLPRKPLVRGLSSVVASLRKLEEDALDDDLEALREMECGADQPPKPKDDIAVEDSQAHKPLLGGFDDEAMYDNAPEEELDRDGRPLRVFKKKGQKRTTKRVNIRPSRLKRPATQDEGASPVEDDGEVIPETQFDATIPADQSLQDMLSGSEFASSGDEATRKDKKDKKAKKAKKAKKPAVKEGTVKKAARKVNELAHANFKRLKLRNKGGKGGPGHNSRFRRRR